MPTRGFVSMVDASGEPTSFSFNVQDIGAANFATVTQDIDEVKDAILAFVGGEVIQAGFTKTFPEAPNPVTNAEAQREKKWLITYRDTTQFLDAGNTIANPGYLKVFTAEIGTALLDDGTDSYLIPGTDVADYAGNTDVSDFVDVIVANIRSPYNHTAVAPSNAFIQMKYVGRNS